MPVVADEAHVEPLQGAGREPRLVWRGVAGLAAQQMGLVTRAQLREKGLSKKQIEVAVRMARLHPRRRGVYAVGHTHLSRDAKLLELTLAAGPGSVLDGTASLAFWDVLRADRPVGVLVPRHRRHRPGLKAAQRPFHPKHDVRHRRGVPVLEPIAALADAAAQLTHDQVQHCVDELDTRKLLHPRAVERLLRSTAGRPGATKVRAALGNRDPSKGRPNSRLEQAYARFAKRHGLPPGQRGGLIDIGDGTALELKEMDVWYPGARLIVELDGCAVHGTARAKARDARRDRRLLAAQIKTVRVTWADLDHHAAELAEDLLAILS